MNEINEIISGKNDDLYITSINDEKRSLIYQILKLHDTFSTSK